MEAYEGYFEDGQFFPIGRTISIQGRRRVILTLVDDPMPEQTETPQAKTWREFFEAINASDEEIPSSLERVNIVREVQL